MDWVERNRVVDAVLSAIESSTRILIQPGTYEADWGDFHYQFEGEEDLLHLTVTRIDGRELSPEEGQAIADHLFQGIPVALIWIRPGKFSQHFFIGHDDYLAHGERSVQNSR